MYAERVCERMSLYVHLGFGHQGKLLGVLVLLPLSAECPSMFAESSEEGKGNGICLCSHKQPNVCMFEARSAVFFFSFDQI